MPNMHYQFFIYVGGVVGVPLVRYLYIGISNAIYDIDYTIELLSKLW